MYIIVFLIYVDFKKVVGLPTHKLKQKALSVYPVRFGFYFWTVWGKGKSMNTKLQ